MNWKLADHDKRDRIPTRFSNYVSLITETNESRSGTQLTVIRRNLKDFEPYKIELPVPVAARSKA
jgi:hypothetical protein